MKENIDFDRIIERRGTDSFKWRRYHGTDVLPLWVADMDFASPPAVIEALHRRVDHGIFGYGAVPAELVQSVIGMLAQDYCWQVRPEWIIWLPGLVSGLNLACRAIGSDNDDVITTAPIYPPFLSAPGFSRRNLITVELVRINGCWGFDFDALEKAITSKTRLFMLCNPHNPTGRVFDPEELRQLHDICRSRDIVICSDEIHCQLILSTHKRHVPFASLGAAFEENSITLMAPSKTYNIPGLACSFAVIPDETLRRNFKAVKSGIVPEVNVLGYAAALAAYQEGGPWLARLLDYLRGNHDLVKGAVDRMPGLRMDSAQATYLAWIDARRTGLEDPALFFEKAGIGLSDGREFGAPGYLRLNFGCPRATLAEALHRMQKALEKRAG